MYIVDLISKTSQQLPMATSSKFSNCYNQSRENKKMYINQLRSIKPISDDQKTTLTGHFKSSDII